MPTPFPWADLGAELRAARHRTTYTQHHIARAIGISQAAYSLIERGRIRPRPALVCRFAVVLGADITVLATLADYPLEAVIA